MLLCQSLAVKVSQQCVHVNFRELMVAINFNSIIESLTYHTETLWAFDKSENTETAPKMQLYHIS